MAEWFIIVPIAPCHLVFHSSHPPSPGSIPLPTLEVPKMSTGGYTGGCWIVLDVLSLFFFLQDVRELQEKKVYIRQEWAVGMANAASPI